MIDAGSIRGAAARWLRRTVLAMAAVGLLAAVTVVRLQGHVHEELGPLGARIAEWTRMASALHPEEELQSAPRVLQLNGLSLEIDTRLVDQGVEEVLAELRRDCPSADVEHTSREGYFFCMEDVGGASWPHRISAFAESHDVAELGPIRYAYVSASPGDAGSLVVRMRPVGRFVLDDLLPDLARDVPGHDPDGLPRPDGAKRVLYAEEQGEPYAIVTFGDPARDRDELLAFYREHMDRERFAEIDLAATAERIGERYDEPVLYFLDHERPGGFLVLYFENAEREVPFRSYATAMEAR